jgi:hypothetical protein
LYLTPFQGLGGVLKYNTLPAPDLATVSRYPFSGNWPGAYSREVDPWQRSDFKAYRSAANTLGRCLMHGRVGYRPGVLQSGLHMHPWKERAEMSA